MKFVVTGDWHGDAQTHGVRRFEDVREAAHATVDAAIAEGAIAYAFLGDLCDPDSGARTFRVIQLALEIAMRLKERSIASIWLAGNHDVIEDGSGDTTLSPLRALGGNVYVAESPSMLGVGSVRFWTLPFAATARHYDPEKAAKLIDGPRERNVVLGHLTEISGVEPGEETLEMPRGRGVRLPVEELVPRACMIFNGHFHRRQKVGPVWLPGALARLTFCEEGHSPGFMVAEVEG